MALEQPPKKQIPTSKRIKRIAIALAVLAMYIWTFVSIDIDFARVIERASANFSRVLPRLFSPNWDMAGEVVEMLIETIYSIHSRWFNCYGRVNLFGSVSTNRY